MVLAGVDLSAPPRRECVGGAGTDRDGGPLATEPHCEARLHDRATAAQQAHHEQHEGDHEQHVHKRADRIGADDSEKPRDEQDNRECIQLVLPPVGLECRMEDLSQKSPQSL